MTSDRRGLHTPSVQPGRARHSAKAPPLATLKNPVFGMTLTEQSPHRFEHAGRAYYFCGANCKANFAAEPAKFLQPGPAAQPAAMSARCGFAPLPIRPD